MLPSQSKRESGRNDIHDGSVRTPQTRHTERRGPGSVEDAAGYVVRVWLAGPPLGAGELGFALHRLKDALEVAGSPRGEEGRST